MEMDAQVKESKSEIQRLNLEVEQKLQSISAELNAVKNAATKNEKMKEEFGNVLKCQVAKNEHKMKD